MGLAKKRAADEAPSTSDPSNSSPIADRSLPDKLGSWTKEKIQNEIAATKRALDAIGEKQGTAARLDAALGRIAELEDDLSPGGILRRYIHVVSALYHHARHAGLSDIQIRRLSALGTALLRALGIRPDGSKRAFLYADLHLALSEVYRQSGAPWKSAWEQQLGMYLSPRSPAGGKGLQALLLGVRAFRLGHVLLANRELTEAESEPLSPESAARCRLERIKAQRFLGDWKLAETLTEEARGSNGYPADVLLEIEWEAHCRHATRTGDIAPLTTSARKGKPHHDVTYVLEAFLWQRCSREREWLARFPTAKSLARDSQLKLKSSGALADCCDALAECLDSSIPLPVRVERLGHALFNVAEVKTVDQEALVWAAAARTLARIKSDELAALTLSEYRALSLRLTSGRREDALGVASDLFECPWFKDLSRLGPTARE